MCGIAGLVSGRRQLEPSSLQAMVNGLEHRGPDDRGIWLADDLSCGLGHTRLSVIDLSAQGHQPMRDENSGNIIVFNGEIYNFQALRRECEHAGHEFHSHSDTEVILALYALHGTECLRRLRGMFAFAIWDATRRQLFMARDRVGKKPFHYALSPAGLAFCSEIHPLSQHPWTDRELDIEALDLYLQLQAVPSPSSIYRGIRKLPPGHYGIYANGQLSLHRYWAPDYRNKLKLSENDALDAFEEKLTEAVKLRLISDVPVGALLSGGVDSSLVVRLMSRLTDAPVHTFSVGFAEQGFDESPYALEAAEACGTIHHPSKMLGPPADGLENLVRRYGEPFADYSALPSFFVCQAARERVTVVLNGDGGDELLGGYPRYPEALAAEPLARQINRWLPIPLSMQVSWLLQSRGFPFRKLHRNFLKVCMRDAAPLTMLHGVGSEQERLALLGMRGPDRTLHAWRLKHLQDARRSTDNPIDSMLWIDNQTYLPDHLLVKMDIASMHCGLEARSPFLDHELIELCARLPIGYKVRAGVGKYLIKALAERYFTPEFVHRRKMGFGIPLREWLLGPMAPLVRDVLRDTQAMAPLDTRRVAKYVQQFMAGHPGHQAVRIWTLLMYGLWRRHCYLA